MKMIIKTGRKKVLHIGQDTGGVKTYMVKVFDYCNPEYYEFIVLAPKNELFENYCKQKFIRYYPVNLLRGGGAFSTLSALKAIIKVIIIEKPDIIHAHSAKGGFLGRLAAKLTRSKNVIYTPHAFSYLSFTGLRRIIFFSLEVMAKNWATVLLAISYSEADKAVYELGYKRNDVKLILNSIPVTNELIIKQPESIINIRMIGRLTIQKNPILFLEIAKSITDKYNNIHFSILGAGIHDDLTEEISNFVTQNSLENKVSIEGWADDFKSKSFLQATDIFLMTSIFEGLPYSLLEAMALGKACIVSDVDGNRDVIKNGENGFTCITKNDFCEKIELLLRNKDIKEKVGAAAFSYVKRYHNIRTNILQLEELYTSVYVSRLKSQTDNIIPYRSEHL